MKREVLVAVAISTALLLVGLCVSQVSAQQQGGTLDTIRFGLGFLLISSGGGGRTIQLDTSLIPMRVPPPSTWPPDSRWCKSANQFAEDATYRYGCHTLQDQSMQAQRWKVETTK